MSAKLRIHHDGPETMDVLLQTVDLQTDRATSTYRLLAGNSTTYIARAGEILVISEIVSEIDRTNYYSKLPD